jgi:hypothetical protein
MKLILTALSMLFISITAFAQLTKDYTITDVSKKLEVSTGIEISVVFGTTNSLKITSNDADYFEKIKVENSDGNLKVYFDSPKEYDKKWQNRKITGVLTITQVPAELMANSGGEISWMDIAKTTDLKITCHSGANIEINIAANAINANCHSGAEMELQGTAKTFIVESNSGANINAQDLKTETCTAISVSGSNIKVNVTEKLIAESYSGGNIKFIGNPKSVSKSISSGGSVKGKKAA